MIVAVGPDTTRAQLAACCGGPSGGASCPSGAEVAVGPVGRGVITFVDDVVGAEDDPSSVQPVISAMAMTSPSDARDKSGPGALDVSGAIWRQLYLFVSRLNVPVVPSSVSKNTKAPLTPTIVMVPCWVGISKTSSTEFGFSVAHASRGDSTTAI